ncbi:MAG: flagellar hook capping FlgD N-terminal domain-containing protein [Bryobacteraceae bacterium]|jgi:flagellar basal-body rod modification protein FlgD
MAPTGTSTSSSSTASSSASAASDQDMFLQLLVSQLENQDPLNPVDGTTFVTQLAEFQQLDTSISTGSDVSSILQDLNGLVGNGNTNTTAGNTGNTSGATGATTNS